MKTTSYKVNSISKAWAKVNELFPTDYNKDENSSARAGYNVYRSTVEYYNYICDLGDRLEVNLANGETINIWIVENDEAAEVAAIMENSTGHGKRIEVELTTKESKETKHFANYADMIKEWRFWFASGNIYKEDEETFQTMINALIRNNIDGAEMGIVRNGLHIQFIYCRW